MAKLEPNQRFTIDECPLLVLTQVSFMAKHTLAFQAYLELKFVYTSLQLKFANMHPSALTCLSVTTQNFLNKF
jgi:hypothetical protein